MRIRLVIAASLIILLTTINSKQNFVVSTFSLKKIIIENNLLLTDKDIKSLLVPIYDKNLLFLENDEVKKALMQSSYIASLNIQKKYPSTLKIKIFEKKPIAILLNNKKKFYLSERIDLIEFKKIPNYQNLPYIFGNREDFKIFYNNLKKINFPFEIIKKYILYETNRWDLETKNNKIIMLPSQNYIKSLKNYLNLKNKNGFERYELFDYRISNQLILK